jgi:hypothetical protein
VLELYGGGLADVERESLLMISETRVRTHFHLPCHLPHRTLGHEPSHHPATPTGWWQEWQKRRRALASGSLWQGSGRWKIGFAGGVRLRGGRLAGAPCEVGTEPSDLANPSGTETHGHVGDSLPWTHKPAPRCRPRPGEALWSVKKGDVTWSAELRYHGEYGVEAQILRNGDLRIPGTFVLRELAVGWAKNERDRLEGDDPFA